MKNCMAVLILALLIFNKTDAQTKKKIHSMMISIHSGHSAHHPEMIITKEDGTQEIIVATRKSWMWTAQTFSTKDGGIEANEDSLFLTLKPYFENGWKLVSANVTSNIITTGAVPVEDYIARYFFTKEDD
jgi:hypothetical protein